MRLLTWGQDGETFSYEGSVTTGTIRYGERFKFTATGPRSPQADGFFHGFGRALLPSGQ
jgi:hypothetical protein